MYKRKKSNLFWLLAFVISLGWFADNYAQNKTGQEKLLKLTVASSQGSYVMGELVELTASVKNIGKNKAVINKLLTIESGNLQIFIAGDDREFGSYLGPGWGIDERMIQYTLNPGESISDSDKILWNFAPAVTHLNARAAKQAQKGRVPTSYAFDKPGLYRIKLRDDKTFESNEIIVVIEEPTGDDLQIWQAIKDRPDLGFFIQKGSPQSYDPAEMTRVKKGIESLLEQHPNGKISNALRESLVSFSKKPPLR